jgi:hypothetical protein
MANTIRTAILASATLVAGAAVGVGATLALTPAPVAPAPIVHVAEPATPAPTATPADTACRDAVDLLIGMHDTVHVELVNVILADLYAGTPRDWSDYEAMRAQLGSDAEANVWPVVRACLDTH